MITEYLKNLYKKVYIFHNLYIKNKVHIKKKFYSQNKEDVFVLNYFKKKNNGFYVDVGCHHPTRINNTYLLYRHGWRGVNIDMSKLSIDLFNILRKNDVNVHSAVSTKNKKINYYTNKGLFLSASIIQKKNDAKFKYKEQVSSKPLTIILDKTIYKRKQIDFLSIDAEGADYEVLRSLDLKKYKPKLICIEIWGDWKNQKKKLKIKNHKIYKYLVEKNYKLVTNLAENFIFKKVK
tara:strand:+ start:1529 stop:2233 length:705 start_codon:yes stop_codon:yes gene_type:complete